MTPAGFTGTLPQWVDTEGSGEHRPRLQVVADSQIQATVATEQCGRNVTRPVISKKPQISIFMKSLLCLNLNKQTITPRGRPKQKSICGRDLTWGHRIATSALNLRFLTCKMRANKGAWCQEDWMGFGPSCFTLRATQEALDKQGPLTQSWKVLEEHPPQPSHSTKRKRQRGPVGDPQSANEPVARGGLDPGPRTVT